MGFTDIDPKVIRPALSITPAEVNTSKEIINKRAECRKIWDIGGGKHRMVVGLGMVHYKNDYTNKTESWKEIDLTLEPDGTCNKAPYTIQVFTDRVGFSYVSKRGGRIDVELDKIGGKDKTTVQTFTVVQEANQLFWNNVDKDIDIKVLLRPQSVEIFKLLKTDKAAKNLKWKYTKYHGDSNCNFKKTNTGIDDTQPKSGNLEIISSISDPVSDVDKDVYYMDEEWTGRVGRIIDKKTKIKEWGTDPVYPVIIDAVTYDLGAGADDVSSNAVGTATTYFDASDTEILIRNTGAGKNGGFRFVSVGIGNGDTITSAILKLNQHTSSAGGNCKVFFSNIVNAGAFTNADRPAAMGNKVPVAGHQGTFSGNTDDTESIACTAGLQTLVSNTGWVSNHAARCGVIASGTGVAQIEALEHAGVKPAKLDVTFTPAAGGSRRIMTIGKLMNMWPLAFLVGAIRNPNLKRREMINPLNWIRKK